MAAVGALWLAAAVWGGCPTGDGPDDPQLAPYDTHREIVRLQLAPTYVELGEGDSEPLTVTAEYDDDELADVTGLVEWVVPAEGSVEISVDDGVVQADGVGVGQVYAALGGLTSNALTVESGHFEFAVTKLTWDGVDHAPGDSVPQGSVVLVTVEVSGRDLPLEPGAIELAVDGLLPFGEDREEHGLDPYFRIVDETGYEGYFIVAPSARTGDHRIDLWVEEQAGDSDDTLSVSSHQLPPKDCPEITTSNVLAAFDERKFHIEFLSAPRAYEIRAEASDGALIDTALWLFDDTGALFSWTDAPRGGGTDAVMPFGVTDALAGTYYLMMTASPLAEDTGAEMGQFLLSCDEEQVGGTEFPGDIDVLIPAGEGPVTLDLDVSGFPVDHRIDRAWVHLDLESDAPNQVTAVLTAPDPIYSVGLRSTGHFTERMAVTWGDLVVPDYSDMTYLEGADPDGTWTLEVEDHSANGATVVHDWRLYLSTSN